MGWATTMALISREASATAAGSEKSMVASRALIRSAEGRPQPAPLFHEDAIGSEGGHQPVGHRQSQFVLDPGQVAGLAAQGRQEFRAGLPRRTSMGPATAGASSSRWPMASRMRCREASSSGQFPPDMPCRAATSSANFPPRRSIWERQESRFGPSGEDRMPSRSPIRAVIS